MTNEYYGHKRAGYTEKNLSHLLEKNGFKVLRHDYFSRFFTEGIELAINFFYVFILNKGLKKKGVKGSISPSSQKDFNVHSTAFRLFLIIYPLLNGFLRLERIFNISVGYCLILEAEKKQ